MSCDYIVEHFIVLLSDRLVHLSISASLHKETHCSSSGPIRETPAVQQSVDTEPAARVWASARHKSGLWRSNPLLDQRKLLIDQKITRYPTFCLQSASVHELQFPSRNKSLYELLEISLHTDAEVKR